MRLYLLPVSTRRTLLYCQRAPATPTKQTWPEWVQSKAARTWADWEKKPGGWQKMVVGYGNQALKRIPYEEWGLKSVPPLSAARRNDEKTGKVKVEVVYPKSLIRPEGIPRILHMLSTEREGLHKRRLLWCIVGMPITIPVALIPVIPNLPFFYLAYRAWSHWRALSGGRHIQFLVKNNLLQPSPSPILDQVYANQDHPLLSAPEPTTDSLTSSSLDSLTRIEHPSPAEAPHHPEGETMLLTQENAQRMTQLLDLPQLEVEVERAIWQVEMAIKAQNGESGAADTSSSSTPTSSSNQDTPGDNSEKKKQ